MESKYKRCTQETVNAIAACIDDPQIMSASDAARSLCVDVSGLIKHIKLYRTLVETREVNKCGRKYACQIKR